MPRYYFDLTEGFETTLDEDGVDVADLDAAKAEAIRTLGEIARAKPETPLAIDVRAARAPYGTVLCTVELKVEDS
jgi:hypothetical protein